MTGTSRNSVDAVIVGAGFSGLYLLHLLRGHGFSTRVFERGGDVGGTWYWNRYPGARCDVESMQYSYSFDDQLQQEWRWTEKYAPQPEILSYIRHVAERFDLKRDITFDTSVTAARFDEKTNHWVIETDTGETVSTRYFIMATGCISAANMPEIEGRGDFGGATYHTGDWPHERIDFSGRRVAVIGTGSSGIQAIPMIAREADQLTVFQRTPHWTIPARNHPMTDDYERQWKDNYAERRAQMRVSPSGSMKSHPPLDISALDATEAEREAVFRERWDAGGMSILKSFSDILTDEDANRTSADWVRQRIRETVKDAAVAEMLCPRTYPIGTKRLCLDTEYYETFNRTNVTLVDIVATPIERITKTGIETTERAFEVDAIVFATGFDGMTGSLLRVDITGRGRKTLQEKWRAGPRTYLGLMSEGFPNLFMITGPGSPSVKSNMLTSIEQHVEYVTDALLYLRENGVETIEPERTAEDDWVDHVQEEAAKTLFPRANSWYMGANIPGKPQLFMPYIGGAGQYRQICDAVAADGYRGFVLGKNPTAASAAE